MTVAKLVQIPRIVLWFDQQNGGHRGEDSADKMSSRMINCIQRQTVLFRPACILAVIMAAVPGLAQHERGQIHLQVQDQSGGPLQASVELVSEMNQVQRSVSTDSDGRYVARDLPFGVYKL